MKFTDLDLHPLIQETLRNINFTDCTAIQAEGIPHVLAGRDLAGLAQTGTGKTAAFMLPMIDRVLRGRELAGKSPAAVSEAAGEPPVTPAEEKAEAEEAADAGLVEKPHHVSRFFEDWRPRQFILVLVPTRELAEQVMESGHKFMAGTGLRCASIYGGTSYDKQKAALRDGVEFIVATPGRLIDLYKEHLVDLRQVRAVIFDEADRMFDMGFKDDMKFILRRMPRDRQFLVFSATLNFDVLNVAYEFGAQPIEINVSKDQAKADNVDDEIFHIGQHEKPAYLLSLLKKHQPRQAMIFSNFKHNVERIAQFLSRNGVPAMGISSLLTQAQRTRVMEQFRSENDRNILVATDVAARGLDVLGVDMVFNYELPDDAENYVHRIGRTGRAGNRGRAFSLVSDRDVEALSRIEEYLGHKIAIGWMESTDLVTDFQAFPEDRDLGFRRRGGPSQPSREDRQRFRGQGGGGGSRPPRRDHPRGDRPRGDRPDRGPRGDSPRQFDRPRSEGGGRPDSAHRDRRLGRHGGNQSGSPSGGRDQHRANGSDRPRGEHRHEGRPRHHHNRDNPRSHQNGPRRDRPQGSRPIRPHTSRPGQRASAPSLGQKVTSFFKKLFGE